MNLKNISPTLVNKTDITLGKGRFAMCIKGYLQGTSICIKIPHDETSTNFKAINLISKEANILSQLSHPAVCFLLGIQKPYYLITNLYEVRGYTVTAYDLLFPNDISNPIKKKMTLSLCCEIDVNIWFKIILHIAEGIDHFHQKGIVHRDLKMDNVVLYEQNKNLMPVIIDFGKRDLIKNTRKYSLTKEGKSEYRAKHKHIAPDLIDGIATPSTSSDMYSYGRIVKSIVRHFPISSELIPSVIVDMVNNCLCYNSSKRPTAKSVISTLRVVMPIV